GLRRRARDGGRLRRGAARQRDLARRGPARDGAGDAPRGRGRPRRPSRRADPAPPLRRGLGPHRGQPRADVSERLPERAPVDELADRWCAAWTGTDEIAGVCTPDVRYEDPLVTEPSEGI